MKISANQILSKLDQPLLPCYLVTGDEHLLVQEILDAIRAAARAQGFGTRDLFVQTTGFDWSELSAAGGNMSLFAERQIIELRLPTGKPGVKGSAAIAEFAANAGEDILFIVSAPKLDRNAAKAKWASALDQQGAVVQVWPVSPRDLPGWINARMKQARLQPD
ncbi:MAG: DNA polymerase III subunit delta, partial [Woeseiaceae bacterium]|nr:DNA polymerase III subunit delta [Woeseiaceae bacterium]